MLCTKRILGSVAILSLFVALPALACHQGTPHGKDTDCDTSPPEPRCPCFDRAFLDTLNEQEPANCFVNDKGDRPDRPELAIIDVRGGSWIAFISPGKFAWTCHTDEPGFISQEMPVAPEERIVCAEILLSFIVDNALVCP